MFGLIRLVNIMRRFCGVASAYIRAALRHAFENEDKPMIEAQQRRIGERDFWNLKPLLLKTDAAAVLARRKLELLIAQEAAVR